MCPSCQTGIWLRAGHSECQKGRKSGCARQQALGWGGTSCQRSVIQPTSAGGFNFSPHSKICVFFWVFRRGGERLHYTAGISRRTLGTRSFILRSAWKRRSSYPVTQCVPLSSVTYMLPQLPKAVFIVISPAYEIVFRMPVGVLSVVRAPACWKANSLVS